MRKSLLPLLAVALTALSTPIQAQAQVRLVFDWPDGLQATVTHTKSKTRSGASAPAPNAMTTFYDLKATRRGTETVVSMSNLRLDPKTVPPALNATERKQLEILLRAALPSFTVKASGEFGQIEDPAAFQRTIETLVKQALPEQAQNQGLRDMLSQVTSERVLNGMAAADWGQYVSFWVGASLEAGETYTTEYKGSLPMLPGQEITMRSTFEVSGEVSCARAGQPRRCVKIEMRTRSDAAEVKAAVESVVQKMAPKATANPLGNIDTLSLEQTLSLVTEPQGLIPHSVGTRKKVTVVTKTSTGPQEVSEVQETQWTYRYDAAAH